VVAQVKIGTIVMLPAQEISMKIRLSILAAAAAVATAFAAHAQTTTTTTTTTGPTGVNVGSLTCNVAGGVGFIFGSSKELNCVFSGNDGAGQYYKGQIKKFGIDIGFTKEAQIIWLVFAPGKVQSGALAGDYAGLTASATVGVGIGANILIGGSGKQISLQPVSVEGSKGLNIALGVGEITLEQAK